MISNIFDKNIVKVISYFLISPGSRYTRKELKEKTEMNNIPLDITLTKLLALKILSKKNNLYQLSQENENAVMILEKISKEYKEFNIPYKIFNILVETSDKLSKYKSVKSAILFGSYAKLIHTDSSDIDVAVIIEDKNKKENKQDLEKVKKEISKISNKIELNFFQEKDLKEKDLLIQDIKRNGKPIL